MQYAEVLPVERRLADQHLVEQHAEAPPVHAVGVLHTLDDLSRNIFSCSNLKLGHETPDTRHGRDIETAAARARDVYTFTRLYSALFKSYIALSHVTHTEASITE